MENKRFLALELTAIGDYDCESDRHHGQELPAKYLILLCEDKHEVLPTVWKFWAACAMCHDDMAKDVQFGGHE